ncbi:MAG: hypothetical protein K6F20_01585 [Bacteroidaceae bacterium]|nr:hypothetical protein [Bacteroidaceae bacterium]
MKRTYQKPLTQVVQIAMHHIIALSGGEQTTAGVNNPNLEVDAGNALSRRRNLWDDEW